MSFKTFAAALALGAVCAVPTIASAGGEIQEYEHTRTTTMAAPPAGAYAPPMPSYARPMSMYGAGTGYGCPTAPYGYGYGHGGGYAMGGGGGFGNDIFTAGLLGLGIGYLLFH